MILSDYFSRLGKGLSQAKESWHWQNYTVQLSLRTALTGVTAVLLALMLHLDKPYWSGITAVTVSFASAGASFNRMILRLIATIGGSLLGLLCAVLTVQNHFLFILSFFLICLFGIYMTNRDKKYMYVWLLGYLTAAMVVLYSLNDPLPNSFIATAFYRGSEISLGVFVAYIWQQIFRPEQAYLQFQKELIQSAGNLCETFDHFEKHLWDKNRADNHDYDVNFSSSIQQLEKANELYITATLEGGKPELKRLGNLLSSIHNAIELIITKHHNLQQDRSPYINHIKSELENLMENAQSVFRSTLAFTRAEAGLESIQKDIDRFTKNWKTLKRKFLHNRESGVNRQHQMAEIDQTIDLAMSLRLMVFQISDAIQAHPDQKTSYKPKTCPNLVRLFQFDTFYLKHAFVGAMALVVGPITWLAFALPGFSQIAISVGAVIGMNPEATRYKAFLRLLGCLSGAIVVILVLGLNIQSTPIMLAVAFCVLFIFLLLHYSNANVSYLGTQAAVVVFVGLFSSFAPEMDFLKPLDRLIGISGGICCVLLFQHVFWAYRAQDRLVHCTKQIQLRMYPFWSALDDLFCGRVSSNWAFQASELESSRQVFRVMKTISDDKKLNETALKMYVTQKTSLRLIHKLLLIHQHMRFQNEVEAMAPSLKNTVHDICQLFKQPILNARSAHATQKKLNDLIEHLKLARQDIRNEERAKGKSIIATMEVIAYLHTLVEICQEKHEEITLYNGLIYKKQKAKPLPNK